jgi:hypothetical protein
MTPGHIVGLVLAIVKIIIVIIEAIVSRENQRASVPSG